MGEEAAAQGVSVLLGPGLNIKRSPCCGRNSSISRRTPTLPVKMAAAYVRGIQKNGMPPAQALCCEQSGAAARMASDSIVDERTLREIYLDRFEMVVKEAQPKTSCPPITLSTATYANENATCSWISCAGTGALTAQWSRWGGSNDHALGVKERLYAGNARPRRGRHRELMKAVQTGKITEADVDAGWRSCWNWCSPPRRRWTPTRQVR